MRYRKTLADARVFKGFAVDDLCVISVDVFDYLELVQLLQHLFDDELLFVTLQEYDVLAGEKVLEIHVARIVGECN